jgi:hypothetical protein
MAAEKKTACALNKASSISKSADLALPACNALRLERKGPVFFVLNPFQRHPFRPFTSFIRFRADLYTYPRFAFAGLAFKQQQLPAWQPILTPQYAYATFFIVGAVFLSLGVLIFDDSMAGHQQGTGKLGAIEKYNDKKSVEMDTTCTPGSVCIIEMNIGKLQPPRSQLAHHHLMLSSQTSLTYCCHPLTPTLTDDDRERHAKACLCVLPTHPVLPEPPPLCYFTQ